MNMNRRLSFSTEIENTKHVRNRRNKKQRSQFPMNFRKLEKISKMDSDELILTVSKDNSGWEMLLQTKLSTDGLVLIIEIVSKICDSTFLKIKSKILLQICDTDFMTQLYKYLRKLPFHTNEDKRNNTYFWDTDYSLFNYLFIVFDNIMKLMPQKAAEILPKMLAQTCHSLSKMDIVVKKSVKNKLNQLWDLSVKIEFDSDEEIDEIEDEEEKPPDDFRMISVRPSFSEVTSKEPVFIRSNIVQGRYTSVDHYLDVNFRLLREDFVAPLRNAICDYRNGTPRKRICNVRFYHNVRILHSTLQQGKVIYFLHLINKDKEKLELESKNLMFGSLLCFTNDNFKSITFATVANSDKRLISRGQIAVEFIDQRIEFCQNYTMLECAVYFEPYYHVLHALKNFTEETFPLKQYIIDVKAVMQPPAYYQKQSRITYSGHNFQPLISSTWPSANQLKMDASQFRAFHAAVTREFCVIQGPPGTGKTYVGLKVAEILLENHEAWNKDRNPILVIACTNHALDQFLEGILEFTEDIIRVGGQSKSLLLENYNIREQRRRNSSYRVIRDEMQKHAFLIKPKQLLIERAQKYNSILNFSLFLESNPTLKNTWFVRAPLAEQLKWLMDGPTKRQSSTETEVMRETHLLSLLKIEESATDSADSDEFFDCESDHRKLNDDEEDSEEENGEEDVIVDVTESSLFQYQCRIHKLESELAEIERAECKSYSQSRERLKLSHRKKNTLKLLVKVMDNYKYLQFRMEEQRQIMPTVQLPDVNFSKPHGINFNQRWQIYACWMRNYLTDLQNTLSNMIKDYQKAYMEFNELRQIQDVNLMRDRKVIGMTTTGAARYQPLLQALKCPIVIVEEAAQVLESHVIAGLTSDCKHLILIGDHQQLRPSTVEYSLAKEHNLDISLFERMVKNGIYCECLKVQHRMRPEISRLIVPAIYPNLQDHKDVKQYPNVRGITQNVFFISHTEFEASEKQTTSKTNRHEADFIIQLARYLLLQDYKSEDITILTVYSGQKRLLLEQQKKNPILENLRINNVDEYQGEECKIILLTLVRSNKNAKIGFLSIDNRVNVALSRAKRGLFMIGNMDNLMQADNVWPKINQVLLEHNQIGTHLTLKCQIHKKETKVKCAEDFVQVSLGGCDVKCNAILKCGHYCSRFCHVIGLKHIDYKCREKCKKVVCKLNHQCRKLCFEECTPCKVKAVHLPCGHDAQINCSKSTSDYKCLALVNVTLDCGHVTETLCYKNIHNVICARCDIVMQRRHV